MAFPHTPQLDDVKTSLTSKSSQKIGEIGEKAFCHRLTNELNIPWKDMSKTPHAGDFHVTLSTGTDVLFDVKSYTNPVPVHEITKKVKYGKFTSVEICKSYIDRINKFEKDVKAWAYFDKNFY